MRAIVLASICILAAGCQPAANGSEPPSIPHARVAKVELIDPPAATFPPKGCVATMLFDNLGYHRRSDARPRPKVVRYRKWRIDFVGRTEGATKVQFWIRGFGHAPQGVAMTLRVAAGEVSASIPVTLDATGREGNFDVDGTVVLPPGADRTDLLLEAAIEEPASVAGGETNIQIDSIDLSFQPETGVSKECPK